VSVSPREVACPACFAPIGTACSAPTDTGRRLVTWHHDSRESSALITSRGSGATQPRHRLPDAPLILSIRQQRQVRLGRQLGLSEREIARDLAPQLDGVTVDEIVRAIR
jgi:hypothetical protein